MDQCGYVCPESCLECRQNFPGIFDPDAVERLCSAGVGSEVTVTLGGRLAMPALRRENRPIEISGRVKCVTDGRFKTSIAMGRGLMTEMGKTAVLSVGSVDIMVISRHFEPVDPGCFRSVGIEPTERRFLICLLYTSDAADE